ncbi:hypothetical protein [Chryseobacterium lathyri]|uniref:hypothetical protein n=1 Tax=Chryseobacterium lathyri TaxID=395933 RepID=UPI0027847273|nr:hypothetical protein [Chryseobacterium lathyri]MDQ0066052.1 hypothetical protein [Chryseobacterium lathyri]
MNNIDKKIYEIYLKKDNLILVQEYFLKNKIIDIIFTSFIQDTKHIFEIYRDRLEFSEMTRENYVGLSSAVYALQNTKLDKIKVSSIEGLESSCTIFSNDDYSIILGVIFTRTPEW